MVSIIKRYDVGLMHLHRRFCSEFPDKNQRLFERADESFLKACIEKKDHKGLPFSIDAFNKSFIHSH
jgi:hypothetical protein